MPRSPDLSHRQREPERMDDPGLAPAAHRQALAGLRRLDRAARAERLLWPLLRDLTLDHAPLRVLDLACGGGEPAIPLALAARRAGLALELTACDRSATALEVTAERARAAGLTVIDEREGTRPGSEGSGAPGGVPGGPRTPHTGAAPHLRLVQTDVLASPPDGRYDVVMCSLFLHHLSDAQAIQLLSSMRERARRAVLVHDLRRSRRGWWLARLASRALTRSPIVHFDALRSVEAAFTVNELGFLAGRAGLNSLHTRIDVRWPERLLLTWKQP